MGARRLEGDAQRDEAALAMDLAPDEPRVQSLVDGRQRDAGASARWVGVPRLPPAAAGSGAVVEVAGGYQCLCVCIECGNQADRILTKGSEQWATELEQVPEAIRGCVREYLVGMHKRRKVVARLKQDALESKLRSRYR